MTVNGCTQTFDYLEFSPVATMTYIPLFLTLPSQLYHIYPALAHAQYSLTLQLISYVSKLISSYSACFSFKRIIFLFSTAVQLLNTCSHLFLD